MLNFLKRFFKKTEGQELFDKIKHTYNETNLRLCDVEMENKELEIKNNELRDENAKLIILSRTQLSVIEDLKNKMHEIKNITDIVCN